ncbi:MAG: hypothetical protein K2Y37_25725 [Pirellulales bacterium]|nr:hypothetical protein [Pirellulales bacterium]
MSLFRGINDVVFHVMIANGLTPQGQDFRALANYQQLQGLIQDQPAMARQLFAQLFSSVAALVAQNARHAIDNGLTVHSATRGVLRREVTFSTERQLANRAGRDLEVTIERLACYFGGWDPLHEWFNQFNVAGGFSGGDADNRAAIDLVRRSRHDPGQLDFIELKSWNGDHPFAALVQLFQYWCAVYVLGVLGNDIGAGWQDIGPIQRVRLILMGPRHWAAGFPMHNEMTWLASIALNQLDCSWFTECSVVLSPVLHILDGSIQKDGLAQSFYATSLEVGGSLSLLLDPCRIDSLQMWILRALTT